MKAPEKDKLKEWLKNCPNKKLVGIFLLLLFYRLGYVIGVFLANIGF